MEKQQKKMSELAKRQVSKEVGKTLDEAMLIKVTGGMEPVIGG